MTQIHALRIVNFEEEKWKKKKTNTVTHNTYTHTIERLSIQAHSSHTHMHTKRVSEAGKQASQTLNARLKPADPKRKTHEIDKSRFFSCSVVIWLRTSNHRFEEWSARDKKRKEKRTKQAAATASSSSSSSYSYTAEKQSNKNQGAQLERER